MNLGSRSFPLLRRARGVVSVEQAEVVRRFRAEAYDLSSAEERERLDPLYVAEIADGYATHQGGHLTRDSLLIEELSRYLQEPISRHRHLHSFRPFRRMEKFDGVVASLATPCQYNYYHWMLEALPKLELFRLAGGVPAEARYYAETSKRFQRESLELLGIVPSNVIDSREHQAIRAHRLLAATIPSPSGVAHPWAVAWLRERFFAALDTPSGDLNCLVISRRDAKNRRIVNEEELMTALAPFQPTSVTLDGLPVARQIDLFRRARIIVAPHGAGLTNAAFCQSGARIVELFPATYRNPCFEKLAAVVGCRYRAVVNNDEPDSTTRELNLRVRVAEVAAAACG